MAVGSRRAVAPWDSVPDHDQLFVLITGANSGIGLAIGQRLIDEFLASRPLSAHLILLPTTRSAAKSLDTIRTLRRYAVDAAASPKIRDRAAAAGQTQRDIVARVHVLSLQVDLCDLRGVYALARRLCEGTVSNPEGLEGEYLRDVKVPRLDSVVFNAAYGGWSGISWFQAIWDVLTDLVQAVTWPEFKLALPTCLLNERPQYNYPAKPLLGEVFTACVFGHYILAHELLPLLSRRGPTGGVDQARIIWSGSIEALSECFDLSDLQALTSTTPYESVKRLTDILALTSALPSVKPYSTLFLRGDGDKDATEAVTPPGLYVTHPGVVASTLFPVPYGFMWLYALALVLSRWLGSPWHVRDAYGGAKSTAWVALEPQGTLEARAAQRVKWGSSSNRWCEEDVKATEVEGWGWEGRVEDVRMGGKGESEVGVWRKMVGRKRGAVDVTEEDLFWFEELGAQCWREMERLRHEWEDILGVKER